MSKPAAEPIVESIRLSTRSCRTKYPRPAPSDSRTASSRRRATDCASSRLAILAHAIVNTSATIPSNTYRSEEHTSELQSQPNLVCRLLLEKKKNNKKNKKIN